MIYLTRRERFNAAHRLFRPDWDDNKNVLNQKKHGVPFDEVKTVFAYEGGRYA